MKEQKDFSFLPFEDYSNSLLCKYSKSYKAKVYEYTNCSNHNLIVEGSFNRLLSQMKEKDFAILTAYRSTLTKKENIMRNRIFRGILNADEMGVHQLVGHWRENPNGCDYRDAEENELVDAVERSYFVAKPDSMPFEKFKGCILKCLTIDGQTQDPAIISKGGDIYCLHNKGSLEKIAEKISLNKINQAYSQYIKHLDIPFVFEGVERPGSNMGLFAYEKNGFKTVTL